MLDLIKNKSRGQTWDRLVFKEGFVGNGIATQFTLNGAILNGTICYGVWKVSKVLISLPSDVTSSTMGALYDSTNIITRHRILITGINASGVVTLNYAPMISDVFYIYYWYDCAIGIGIEDYYRENIVSSMEETSASAVWGSIIGTLSNQTDLQNALDAKVDENSVIVAGTKTKITYDEKGLVTEGEDASGGDIINDSSVTGTTVKDALNNLNLVNTISGDITGFRYPELTTVTYNPTDRTVTLTGTVEAYWKGELVSELVNGYVSPAHDSASGQYFLYYNGSTVAWHTTAWTFDMLMIAMAYRDTANFCLRECHGLMDWESHREFHEITGTYLVSGGDLSNFVLSSTTAANRRPYISAATIADEDLRTVNAMLNTNAYTWLYLSSTNTTNIVRDNADIINLSGNNPYYNQFTGGNWVQTLFTNNQYAKIFVMAIPATANTECQKARFVFVQPQTISSTLSTIQAITTGGINLGHVSDALAEYVYIAEIIVRYQGGNWFLVEVNKLTGSRKSQTVTITGSFLTNVSGDNSLSGQGTPASPLSVEKVSEKSKTLSYNLDGTLDVVTDSNGTKTMAYNLDGTLASVTGTGIYKNKAFTYVGGVLTGVTVS